MLYNSTFDYTGDGTLFAGSAVGLITHYPLTSDELPDSFHLYLLYHPNRNRKHSWVLEVIEDNDASSIELDNEYIGPNDTPNMALVCFTISPDFDYIAFDEDDFDTHIVWNSGHTMNDIISMSQSDF